MLLSHAEAPVAVKESSTAPNRVVIEIVAYAPTAYSQCSPCEVVGRASGLSKSLHREQWENSLPGDLAGDYLRLNDWVRGLFRAYGDRINVTLIDAASVEGFWKTLRHGIRRYPAIFVDGKQQLGKDPRPEAEDSIARSLGDLRGGVPCSLA